MGEKDEDDEERRVEGEDEVSLLPDSWSLFISQQIRLHFYAMITYFLLAEYFTSRNISMKCRLTHEKRRKSFQSTIFFQHIFYGLAIFLSDSIVIPSPPFVSTVSSSSLLSSDMYNSEGSWWWHSCRCFFGGWNWIRKSLLDNKAVFMKKVVYSFGSLLVLSLSWALTTSIPPTSSSWLQLEIIIPGLEINGGRKLYQVWILVQGNHDFCCRQRKRRNMICLGFQWNHV